MEFSLALRNLRKELGLTQMELASELNISFATVSRWELGKTYPNRSMLTFILEFARSHSVSESSIESLKKAVFSTKKQKLDVAAGGANSFESLEHTAFGKLINEATFPIYVSDFETEELLYVNLKAVELMYGNPEIRRPGEHGVKLDKDNANKIRKRLIGKKCYKCLMNRESPCHFCNKNQLIEDEIRFFDAFQPDKGIFHRVRGRLIKWNGRQAQIRFIMDMGRSLEISAQREHEVAYEEQIKMRKEISSDAVATAHYNLTHNSVSEVVCENKSYEEIITSKSIDWILEALSEKTFTNEDQNKFKSLFNRESLIQQFYMGNTHISFKHYLDYLEGYFEVTFDLLQNPVTYDIEAFGVLRDITTQVVGRDIVDKLLETDYETITTIDAETGEARPYLGTHIEDVIKEQNCINDNIAGVEAYLRKHCIDEDVEQVIRETSLPYVKQKLEEQPSYVTYYTLEIRRKIVKKRVRYTYLDRRRTTILCAMQDITMIHNLNEMKNKQISKAMEILQEQAGMNVARYDIKTKTFYSNSDMATALGYGDVVHNVPDEFIDKGLIAYESVVEYRNFFDNLRKGKNDSVNAVCKVEDGSFHWMRLDGRIIYDRDGEAYQAIVSFKDIEKEREMAAVYSKWILSLKEKNKDEYTLYRCNLSKERAADTFDGNLLPMNYKNDAKGFSRRVEAYAREYVHPLDCDAYMSFLNREKLIKDYYRGRNKMQMVYGERVSEDQYRPLKITVELVSNPQSSDIEAFIMYEKVEADSMEYGNEDKASATEIERHMEKALTERQFEIYFQPQFYRDTGQLAGGESLVRWRNPDNGIMLPDEFIHIFDDNGFIIKLDEYVWEETARLLVGWIEKGYESVPVSVNLSRRDIEDSDICKRLLRIVNKYNIPIHMFRPEISERFYAENPGLVGLVINKLRGAGFRVIMDDFGCSGCSLNILKDANVDYLKPDMKYFCDENGNVDDGRRGMVFNGIMRISHWLGIPVIAERVESREQADFLQSVGCRVNQGYFFAEPLTAKEFERVLAMEGEYAHIPMNIEEAGTDALGWWNPNSADSQLFNYCMGPAMVFEYCNGDYEIIRMNRDYIKLVNEGNHGGIMAGQSQLLWDDDEAKFKKAVLEAIYSKGSIKVQISHRTNTGMGTNFNITLRTIGKDGDRALILAMVERERDYEEMSD